MAHLKNETITDEWTQGQFQAIDWNILCHYFRSMKPLKLMYKQHILIHAIASIIYFNYDSNNVMTITQAGSNS